MSSLDPTAMTPAQVAELVAKTAKQKFTIDSVRQDIDAGAPTNGDGTVNLVNYAAWLVAQAD